MKEKKIVQKTIFGDHVEDWDFSKANTTYLTHGIHHYPARMIPQIAKRLINRYSKSNKRIVDPFAGSGTVNLEAMLHERYSYGFDINPLAHLIQKVKSNPIEDKYLKDVAEFFKEKLTSSATLSNQEDIPKFPNINLWFKDYVIKDLNYIKFLSNTFEEEEIKNLLLLTLSKTITDVANIDKGDNPYFIRTLKGDKLTSFKPNVRQSFLINLDMITRRIRNFSKKASKEQLIKFQPKLYLKDSRMWDFEEGEINAIITSPPYGEEKNTMSYMRFAKLSLYWMGWTPKELKELEKYSLGYDNGNRKTKSLQSDTLHELIKELETKEQKRRAKEVTLFFQDYYELMEKAFYWLVENGHLCIVIGNRSAKGVPVLNDRISVELGEDIGYSYLRTYYRNIPFKVLPKHDDKTKLINAESIVILKK